MKTLLKVILFPIFLILSIFGDRFNLKIRSNIYTESPTLIFLVISLKTIFWITIWGGILILTYGAILSELFTQISFLKVLLILLFIIFTIPGIYLAFSLSKDMIADVKSSYNCMINNQKGI